MGLALFAAMPVFAQQKATINVHPEQGKEIISKHIYGQFAEHLGTCIYGESNSAPIAVLSLDRTLDSPRTRTKE